MQQLPVLDQSESDGVDRCRCDGGQPKNFARPCLLLLLAESSAHGYELIERLRPFGFEINDPATVYKTLRQMQAESLVTSTWELSTRGPARRVYELTSDGRDLLESWAMTLDLNRAIVGRFLDRYGRLDAGLPPEPHAPLRSAGRARNGTRLVMSKSRGGQST